MKRFILLTLSIIIIFTLFSAAGCKRAARAKDEGKITVTSVIFPSYDFVRVIAGDRVNLILLTSPGSESHTFEPSPRDILTIRESDLFIYTGGENSAWIDKILESAAVKTGKTKVIKLVDLVEVLEEELVEGMEHDDDHYHHDDDDDDGHHDDDHEEDMHEQHKLLDPHVWTSPKNASLIVAALSEALCELDGANADFYRQNTAEYIKRLDELDAAFRAVVDSAKRKTILVADRFPFLYLAHEYGLDFYAAFSGCSTQAEASAATMAFLINKIRSENIPVIFHIELTNENMANILSEETKAKKLLLHSAHNVTMKDFNGGLTYLEIQKKNVENLKEALW